MEKSKQSDLDNKESKELVKIHAQLLKKLDESHSKLDTLRTSLKENALLLTGQIK